MKIIAEWVVAFFSEWPTLKFCSWQKQTSQKSGADDPPISPSEALAEFVCFNMLAVQSQSKIMSALKKKMTSDKQYEFDFLPLNRNKPDIRDKIYHELAKFPLNFINHSSLIIISWERAFKWRMWCRFLMAHEE